MGDNLRLTSRYSTKSGIFNLQPAPAWTAILILIFFSVLCLIAGVGKILNLTFPLAASAVGLLLYFRYPILYIGFTWWIWFLTPLLRRLVDYRSGFTDPSPILLSPYLVTFATIFTLWQYLPKTHRQGGLAFIMSLTGLFYGFSVGLIYKSPLTVITALLDWLVPVIFGFHLFVNWRDYPSYRQNIIRTFLWGVLVMGVYGLIQYLVAPEWDRFWIVKTGLITSQGHPEPLGLRVWSTMNSVEPFAAVMTAGLLLLFTEKGVLSVYANIVGYLSLLLSLVRSAWFGWFAGLLTLFNFLKSNLQMRLIITIMLMALLVVPLTSIEPFSNRINERITTLSDVANDSSARARQETYSALLGTALTSVFGQGIGGSGNDSAILNMLLQLGWFGTILYMGGMSLLVFSLFQGSETRFDLFASAARAIVMSCLVRFPFNIPMVGASGMILWSFLGIGLAARKYYSHHK